MCKAGCKCSHDGVLASSGCSSGRQVGACGRRRTTQGASSRCSAHSLATVGMGAFVRVAVAVVGVEVNQAVLVAVGTAGAVLLANLVVHLLDQSWHKGKSSVCPVGGSNRNRTPSRASVGPWA